MRHRSLVCVLMITLCLGSCARTEVADTTAQIADFYAGLEHAVMQVTMKADFGDRAIPFVLQYAFVRDGDSTVEILAPEEVRGVKAVIAAGQSRLTYEDLILETGPLSGAGLTPVEALPAMLNAWQSAYVSSAGQEKLDDSPCIHVVYKSTVSGVEIQQDAWFAADSFKPLKAETLAGGIRVIECVFDTVTFE